MFLCISMMEYKNTVIMSTKGLDEASSFLEKKLAEYSDSISIASFKNLYDMDKYNLMIASAIEYAKDLNANIDDTYVLNDLISSVGEKIDKIQHTLDQSKENTDECGKLKIILRDFHIIHFGLIGILLVKMDFMDFDEIIKKQVN